jgi:hypothetical protein
MRLNYTTCRMEIDVKAHRKDEVRMLGRSAARGVHAQLFTLVGPHGQRVGLRCREAWRKNAARSILLVCSDAEPIL